jgi:deferrochelatase/peroxidase EfeB
MKVNRRRFLTRSALLFGAGGLAAAETVADAQPAPGGSLNDRIAFDGPHQAGVLTEPRDAVAIAALDAIAPARGALMSGMEALSSRARALTQGTRMPVQEVDEPPADSGTLGTRIDPDALSVTIGLGRSLFDDRYGLTRPEKLDRMPSFVGDRLDPALVHGDAILLLSAHRPDTVAHALRELLRATRDAFALRWWIDGHQGADRGPSARSSRRNLFGFRDGTANPDVNDDALMRQVVWTPEGGTYMAVRIIRMHLEFWDRVGLLEQEQMIGRRRDSGAPLGGRGEYDDARLDLDPNGERIPLDAHIRLAHAARDEDRILRRAWNYQRGIDPAGQLDQGLLFVAFNQDPERQFAAAQKRLAGEPMTDYITPVGGGYYFVPRGARGAGDWVGSDLLR